MQIVTTIFQYILAIIGLSLIIIVHEFGHFSVARLSGMHVEEFFIGFGPKLLKFKDRRGTTYGISAIPVGGYNKILGMDRNESIPPEMKHKSFQNKPFYKKLLVAIGGAGFNVIFAVILIGIILSFAPTTIISFIKPESPADINGFKVGDELISLNDKKIESWDDFSTMTKKYPGEEVTYTVIRDGEEMKLEVRLEEDIEGQGFLGIRSRYTISPRYAIEKFGFFGVIKETWYIIVSCVKALGMLFSGKIPFSEARPVSPIGIVSIFQQSVSISMQYFLYVVVLVSIIMGFGNLIPILPLDGGNIVLIIIESIRRKPVPRKVLEIFNSVGVFILVSIIIIGLVFDIINPFKIVNM